MQRTNIGWTDLSANPLKYRRPDGSTAWGCVKVSPGCAHCYSEAIGNRWNRADTFNAASMANLTPFMDPKELREIVTRKTCQKLPVDGARCFVGDMTDLFGDWVGFELLDQLLAAFALRPGVIFQVLTKRPERAAEYLMSDGYAPAEGGVMRDRVQMRSIDLASSTGVSRWDRSAYTLGSAGVEPWPMPNFWLGTSVENQEAADTRIGHLLRCPAAVRFLSVEPMLGPVAIRVPRHHEHPSGLSDMGWTTYDYPLTGFSSHKQGGHTDSKMPRIHWVIIGCESGPKRRETKLEWVEHLVDQCQQAGVAVFVKQLDIDGKVETDVNRFPPHLRLREFPVVAAVA